jgi:hypothetical protein
MRGTCPLVAGGKYFAARDPKGFSGERTTASVFSVQYGLISVLNPGAMARQPSGFNTKSMLLDKRKRVAR